MPYDKKTASEAGSKSSRAGIPNKVTAKTKEAFQLIMDGNIERFQEWVDSVAETDPKGAFEMMMRLAEYITPKLQRKEHRVEIEEPKQFTIIEDGYKGK